MTQQPTEEHCLVQEVLFVLEGEECFLCRENEGECIWKEIEEQLLEAGAVGFNRTLNGTVKQHNKNARYAMYRHYIGIIEGYCGRNNRIRLPVCVEKQIKIAFPDPDDQFTGFKESNTNN
jgi:hypothetical protein